MMGVTTPTASHLPALTAALDALSPDSLVIEHGAGMYSTSLLCRYRHRVVCVESHPGWLEWAQWMYGTANVAVEFVDSFKRCAPHVELADLLFIDGAARERGPLLQIALGRRSPPTIIVHDTNQDDWHHYGLYGHHFTAQGWTVAHSAEDSHRTTTWRRK